MRLYPFLIWQVLCLATQWKILLIGRNYPTIAGAAGFEQLELLVMHKSLLQLVSTNGLIDPVQIAAQQHTTAEEVATLCGLPQEAIHDPDRIRSAAFQDRLRELVLIFEHIQPRCGNPTSAYIWYRSEPIPSLGDATAEELVKAGHGKMILSYLARIEQGGYA